MGIRIKSNSSNSTASSNTIVVTIRSEVGTELLSLPLNSATLKVVAITSDVGSEAATLKTVAPKPRSSFDIAPNPYSHYLFSSNYKF
jgi:hypothetical protein